MPKIYEVIDCSDDETYCPAGIFESKELAIKALKKAASDPHDSISEHKFYFIKEDFEVFQVIERDLNTLDGNNGVPVWMISRRLKLVNGYINYRWITEIEGALK